MVAPQKYPISTIVSGDGSVGVTPKFPGCVDLRVLSGAGGGGIPGTVQNGITNDLAAVQAAVAALAGAKASWVVFGTLLIGSNYAFPSNVTLTHLPGGMIKPANNVAVSLANPPNASLYQQVFDVSNSGATVSMAAPGKLLDCSGEWFGAIGDSTGVILSTNAYKAAIAFAHGAGDINIRAFPVQYNFDDTLPLCNGSFSHPNLIGCSKRARTTFNYPNLASGKVLLSMKGGSGQLTGNYVYGINFTGNSNSVAVEFNGQCGSWVENCFFDTNATGVRWHNEAVSAFTEFCTIRGCDFRSSCALPREYKVTSGNNSFHGSGSAVAKCTYQIGAGPYVKMDGPGTLVYNAPIYDSVFATSADAVLFQNNNSVAPFAASFAGMFEMETNSSRTITMASGQPVYFVGVSPQIFGLATGAGGNVVAGSLLRVDTHTIYADGSSSFTGGRTNQLFTATSGVPVIITSNMKSTHRLVRIDVRGANYTYRYTLDVDYTNTGAAVTPRKMDANPALVVGAGGGTFDVGIPSYSFDSGALGPPAITGNVDGTFNVTAPLNATIRVSELQLSTGLEGSGQIQF